MNYNKADFIASYGISSQLPESDRPELSFSGRSNAVSYTHLTLPTKA